MDRETERLLNLYLDGLLPEQDRKAFEDRIAKEPGLRKAVALHREAAAEMKKQPALPEGFAERARARLDEESPAPAGPGVWGRFWTWENAGLLAAAGILAAVIFPFLQPEVPEPLPSTKPAAPPASPGKPEPIQPAEDQAAPRVSPAFEDIVPFPSRKEAEAPEVKKVLRETVPAEAGRARPEVRPPAEAAKPLVKSREGGFEYLRRETPAISPAGVQPSPTGLLEVPFRIQPYPGEVALDEAGFAVLKNDSDIASLNPPAPPPARAPVMGRRTLQVAAEPRPAGAGIQFGKEIGILLPAYRPGPPPVRIQVERVHRTETALRVLYREKPVPPEDRPPPLPHPFQIVILPATELEIEVRRID